MTAGAPEPGGLKTANAADGLLTDPDQAGLWEPFTYEAEPGVWLVAKWELTAKLATNGWWFSHWWLGPGSRWWQGAAGNDLPPESAARFPSAEAAAAAGQGGQPRPVAVLAFWRNRLGDRQDCGH